MNTVTVARRAERERRAGRSARRPGRGHGRVDARGHAEQRRRFPRRISLPVAGGDRLHAVSRNGTARSADRPRVTRALPVSSFPRLRSVASRSVSRPVSNSVADASSEPTSAASVEQAPERGPGSTGSCADPHARRDRPDARAARSPGRRRPRPAAPAPTATAVAQPLRRDPRQHQLRITSSASTIAGELTRQRPCSDARRPFSAGPELSSAARARGRDCLLDQPVRCRSSGSLSRLRVTPSASANRNAATVSAVGAELEHAGLALGPQRIGHVRCACAVRARPARPRSPRCAGPASASRRTSPRGSAPRRGSPRSSAPAPPSASSALCAARDRPPRSRSMRTSHSRRTTSTSSRSLVPK